MATRKSAPSADSNGSSKPAKSPRGGSKANGQRLVIVESPTKTKSVSKYLGPGYIVKASVGHVRDLVKGDRNDLGVDVANDFSAHYEELPRAKKVLTELRKLAKNSEHVYLATDPDREGEAIAWHLAEALKVPSDRLSRVTFNEITKTSVNRAFQNPGKLDMDLVDSQETRRILDRIVGFKLSDVLWKKVQGKLSAGRVQSVAVRIIVEREREIEAFIPQESWAIVGRFTSPDADAAALQKAWQQFLADAPEDKARTIKEQVAWLNDNGGFEADLVEVAGKKFDAKKAEDARPIVEALGYRVDEVRTVEWPEYKAKGIHKTELVGRFDPGESDAFSIREIETKPTKSRPSPPFITSTLQQAAASYLGFGVSRTMRVAQQLYEGIDLGDGETGLITYMRTDSTNLSQDAIHSVRGYIDGEFGQKYLPEKPNFYASKQSAQGAHEAIRPTDVTLHPDDMQQYLSDEQAKLYRLIWNRFVACQMPPAEWLVTTLFIARDTSAGEAVFRTSGRILQFDGYLKVTGLPKSNDQNLPKVERGDALQAFDIDPQQKWTSPPPRYSQPSLIKALESENIGRPSTYASIIETIQKRGYVNLEGKAFHPTDIARVVTDKLVEGFPNIMDVQFTAKMEDTLDHIADEKLDKVKVLRDFYQPFIDSVQEALDNLEHAKAETEVSQYDCPHCKDAREAEGKPPRKLVYRLGRRGRFLSCEGYDEIVGEKPYLTKTGKVSKRKPKPIRACDYACPIDDDGHPLHDELTDIICPNTGTPMMKKHGQFGPYLESTHPDPDKRMRVSLDKDGEPKWPKPVQETGVTCHKCGKGQFVIRESKRGPFASCNKFPRCRNIIKHEKVPELQKLQEAGEWPPATYEEGEKILGRDPSKKKGAKGKAAAKGSIRKSPASASS